MASDTQITAAPINPNTFPYLKKFTREELEDLFPRIDRLRRDMTDMVGPSGVVTYMDPGTIANAAFHLAMVGHGDEPPVEKAYIWPDVQPDQQGVFEGFTQWKLRKEHEQPTPPPADPEAVAEAAARAREQIETQLTPEVRRLLKAEIAQEFIRDTTEQDDVKDGAQ